MHVIAYITHISNTNCNVSEHNLQFKLDIDHKVMQLINLN